MYYSMAYYIVVNYASVPIPVFLILDYVCMSVCFYLSVCLCLSVLYLHILYYVIRRPAVMELLLLVAFHCISSCFNYCFVS